MGSSSLPSGFLVFWGHHKFTEWLTFFAWLPYIWWYQQMSVLLVRWLLGVRGRRWWLCVLSLGLCRLVTFISWSCFWRSAIISFMARNSFIIFDSVDVGTCIVFMFLERLNTKSAESVKSSSGVDRDIGVIICETHDGSCSIYKVRRTVSETCFEPNWLVMNRKSWAGVLSPIVMFWRMSLIHSSSEQPVR